METFLWFVATLVAAFLFGAIAIRLKIPAGGMIGGMIGAVVFNLVTGNGYMYSFVKVGVQICLGAMSGSRIGRKDLVQMKKLIVPVISVVAVCMGLNIIFGVIIGRISSMDIATTLLSITPGGATDMVFVAADVGADTGMVGLLQTVRMLFCNCLLPIIFVALINRKKPEGEKVERTEKKKKGAQEVKSDRKYYLQLVRMFVFAAVGGLFFKAVGVPGGTLVGALLLTVVHNCIFDKVTYPGKLKKYQQVFTGTYIGLGITRETISMIPSLAPVVALIILDIMIYVFLMSFILGKISDMDYGTCLLCSTPGGIGEVSILSEELGTDTVQVAAVNTARMIVVVATFPTVIQLLIQFL